MSLKSSIRSLVTMGKGMARGLPQAAADRDPIDLFSEWFDAARESGILLPEAVTLATATADGTPAARMVLLKDFSDHGFEFFTNFGSRKAKELDENPKAALVAYWPVLERQVRIEGAVERVSPEESDAYFLTRARGSQLGAWASKQSEILDDPDELRARFERYDTQFKGAEVPLPPFWGGYRVKPERIEFWQGRLNRLHDRLVFTRSGPGWEAVRLYP
ncbi:MAG: pyridoxamine 5'-phosphate oxidase [Gemmatimonadota bacterium]|nr:MAG: pyridoxamine 5'-phosphate oxidase [Gemmatimonadota bacterium]